MIFKEKFKQQETVVTSESFNKQIFKGVLAWDLVFQSLTIVYCILLADIPVQKLLFSISTGILICILLYSFIRNYIYVDYTVYFGRSGNLLLL